MQVTFCGHSEVFERDDVASWLHGICEQLISEGAQTFYLGGYGAFDHLAAETLRKLKPAYPQIKLILVLPYLNSSMPTAGYDESVYPPLESVPRRYAILRRNEWSVQQADVVVAYVTHNWGGAAKTLQYAQRKHKRVIQYNVQ